MTAQPQLIDRVLASTGTLLDRTLLRKIEVSGFASYLTPQSIHIRPLTVLAGANSAGKSSAIKPLLLLKQTLDAPIDPGPLSINGPNVKFTNLDQMFTRIPGKAPGNEFRISLEMEWGDLDLEFHRHPKSNLEIKETTYRLHLSDPDSKSKLTLSPRMSSDEIRRQIPEPYRSTAEDKASELQDWLLAVAGSEELKAYYKDNPWSWIAERQRCFLGAVISSGTLVQYYSMYPAYDPSCNFAEAIARVIHVPAFSTAGISKPSNRGGRNRFSGHIRGLHCGSRSQVAG